MAVFWWWRLRPWPPWQLVGEIDLPFDYLFSHDSFPYEQPDNARVTLRGGNTWTGPWATKMEDRIDATIDAFVTRQFSTRNRMGDLGYLRIPIGNMYCLLVRTFHSQEVDTSYGSRHYKWLLTPPCYQFADLRAPAFEFEARTPAFTQLFVQPEIQAAMGEVLQGANPGEWLEAPASVRDIRASPSHAAPQIAVALDAFLSNGNRADPRFMFQPERLVEIYVGDLLRDEIVEDIGAIGWEGDELQLAEKHAAALHAAKAAPRRAGFLVDATGWTEEDITFLKNVLESIEEQLSHVGTSRGFATGNTPIARQVRAFRKALEDLPV